MILPIFFLLSISQVDLSLALSTTSEAAQIGTTVVYYLDFTNNGTEDSAPVTITETVPTGTIFNASQSFAGWSCVDGSPGRSTCTSVAFGSIPPGTTYYVTFAVDVVAAAGTITNVARIESSDQNISNNVASLSLVGSRITTSVTIGGTSFIGTQVCAETEGCDRTAYYATHPPSDPVGTPPNIARLVAPSNFSGASEIPLVIMLHGLDGNADNISQQWGNWFPSNATAQQFFVLLPQGTLGPSNHRHWNATDTCCNTNAGSPNRDDVLYLKELILEVERKYHVDPTRVYVMGFSNGAFMSYRLACEIPELVTAIAPMAGAPFQNESLCVGTQPVSVLHIHGTCDPNVRFADSSFDCDNSTSTPSVPDNPNVPGAVQSLSRFASKAGCDISQLATRSPNFDLWHVHTEAGVAGTVGDTLDTTPRGFDVGCSDGYDFDLWEVSKATHAVWLEYQISAIPDGVMPGARVYSWLSAHSRPNPIVCGNGVVEGGEQCDNGIENNDASPCSTSCKAQTLQCRWE